MIDLFREVAKEYITYSTGQNFWRFPRADVWQLYKLERQKYVNPFPPFVNNKDALFDFCKEKLGKEKNIINFYLVKHTNRSFQVPVQKKQHGYIPLNPLNIVVSNKTNLEKWQHIHDLDLFPFKDLGLKYLRKYSEPVFFDPDWQTLVYPQEGTSYFYVEFE
jgi:hypothetical protein